MATKFSQTFAPLNAACVGIGFDSTPRQGDLFVVTARVVTFEFMIHELVLSARTLKYVRLPLGLDMKLCWLHNHIYNRGIHF